MRAPLGLAAVLVASCVPLPAGPPRVESQTEWQTSLDRLSVLRAEVPESPYGMVVRVSLREPRTHRTFAARGAIAVDPHHALRMILLGPGGATAIDAWVTREAYRFQIPALGLVRRGGAGSDASLPVDFFRWWFLAPLDGRLLASLRGTELAPCAGLWFILRREEATVALCDAASGNGLRLAATERSGSALERLVFDGESFTPHAGDRAAYEDARSGVRAEVVVESLDDTQPDPLAFRDPDLAGER